MPDRYAPFAELVQDRLAVIETSALLNRREPLLSDKAPSRRLRLAAVDALAALASQDHATAERAVHSMVNQMIHLAQSVPWWNSLADAAIAETVDYASGDQEVCSAPAQQAWDRYQTAHAAFVSVAKDLSRPRSEEWETLTSRMTEGEADWQAAWSDWHAALSSAR